MKKLALAALAIAAMAACTKSNVQYEQPGEITLQPVAQKATKAAVDGTVYPTTESFNVWAWWGNENAGTGLADFDANITPYIANGTFVYKSDVTSWGGSTPYYWPTKGSLVFAGYSPAIAKGTFEYNLKGTGTQEQDNYVAPYTFKITNYIQSNNIADTKDLMWFDVTDQSYDKNEADNKGVPVTFKHALSWLTFKFNLKEGAPANWTVTNVKLIGIETMANCKIVKGEDPKWSDWKVNDENLDDEEKEAAKTMQIFSGNKLINSVVSEEWENESTSTSVTDFGGTALESTPNGVLVIPQSCAQTDASIVITYDMKTYVENGVLTGQTVELPLTGTQITGNMWEPGKHYIYTITFGANEILIAPTVKDWTDVPVEVPVQ